MTVKTSLHHEITLTFSSDELAQIEAFATLHGVSAAEFIHRAALTEAKITRKASPKTSSGASWINETAAPDALSAELFVLETTPETTPETASVKPNQTTPIPLAKPTASQTEVPVLLKSKSTAGVASSLARGSGPVWEIRQALGRERIHGLGWTREQLAFVLKMSVVGVRKMEHLGKTPSKSPEARRALLTLAQTLEHPTAEISTFIESEKAQLAVLNSKSEP